MIVIGDNCKSEDLKILIHTVIKILLISKIIMDAEIESFLEMWITKLCDSEMFGGILPEKARTEYEVC